MDYYSEALQAAVDQVLRSKERPLARSHRFFSLLHDETVRDPEERGCLPVNTLLETPIEEREITQRAAGALTCVERAFADVLDEAK